MKTFQSTLPLCATVMILLLALAGGCAPAPAPLTAAPATEVASAATGLPASENEPTIASAEKQLGFEIKEPVSIQDLGYVLENVSIDPATRSVCLQYRASTSNGDNLLWVAQGPSASAPPLERVPGWPEYSNVKEDIGIGGAENAQHLSGWRRKGWACSREAEAETTRYSFALAPSYSWESGQQQFDLYSASGGCGTPAGLTSLDLLRVAEELTGTSTHPAGELNPECLHSIADAEQLAGFEIKEPAYLPQDVSFYYATYSETPASVVTLLFLHDQHPDMGRFFQITITQKVPPYFVSSCEDAANGTCEVLQAGNIPVVYQFLDPAEQLDWETGGSFHSVFRSAGEPGKVYKDELLKVVEGMQ